MSRKTVVIWSSPNTDGLTASAKNAVIAGIEKSAGEYEEIHLNRKKISHCAACGNGWGNCRAEGKCILKDDFAEVYQKLTEADGIVFVTAVYWHDLSEQMKAFMDRLRRCEAGHNHFLQGKRCILAACAGGTGNGAVECLYSMEEYIRHMQMKACDRIPVIRFNREYILPALEGAGKAFADMPEEA
ncbi:MAG: flavodoxin family protein [Solobacterium sp.]|nr:flavodoxin family protein [Solobacterium sp.]